MKAKKKSAKLPYFACCANFITSNCLTHLVILKPAMSCHMCCSVQQFYICGLAVEHDDIQR